MLGVPVFGYRPRRWVRVNPPQPFWFGKAPIGINIPNLIARNRGDMWRREVGGNFGAYLPTYGGIRPDVIARNRGDMWRREIVGDFGNPLLRFLGKQGLLSSMFRFYGGL